MFALEFPPINAILRWKDFFPTFNKVALIAVVAAGCAPGSPGSGPAAVGACPMFPADSYWHATVSGLPRHPSSDAWTASIGTTPTIECVRTGTTSPPGVTSRS